MGRFSGRLIDCWRRTHRGRPRVDRVAFYSELLDVPSELDRHTLAVCGTSEMPKWAALECPCGRGHRIVVSLQKGHHPHWSLEALKGAPNLIPSVDSRTDYRCHFWLRDGRAHWVRDRG